jgi:hypothetical protein
VRERGWGGGEGERVGERGEERGEERRDDMVRRKRGGATEAQRLSSYPCPHVSSSIFVVTSKPGRIGQKGPV